VQIVGVTGTQGFALGWYVAAPLGLKATERRKPTSHFSGRSTAAEFNVGESREKGRTGGNRIPLSSSFSSSVQRNRRLTRAATREVDDGAGCRLVSASMTSVLRMIAVCPIAELIGFGEF